MSLASVIGDIVGMADEARRDDSSDNRHVIRSPTPRSRASRSPTSASSRDKVDASRSRSRSARRHKSSRNSKHRHRRSHSRSASRSRSSSQKMRHYINESLSSALQPLQQQLARLSGPAPPSGSVSEFQELRRQQQELAIENKATSLTSSGAKSQYRCLATINLNLNQAVEAIDELLISRPSPDDSIYQALSPIRNSVGAAVDAAVERIDLIFKADLEPRTGWKALSLYEEKKRQPNSDPEKYKAWASCLKAVQESQKKSARPSQQPQPFRQQPGWYSGRSSNSGGSDKSLSSSLINCFLTDLLPYSLGCLVNPLFFSFIQSGN